MRRRGFTLIEMLIVMLVIGILASIAVLKYIDLTNEALSAKVTSEMHVIRLATLNYYFDTQAWPADAPPGSVPPELVSYLPGNFAFTQKKYLLDFDNVAGPSGGSTVGITVQSPDTRLTNKLVSRLGSGTPYLVVGGTLTYVIVDADGIF